MPKYILIKRNGDDLYVRKIKELIKITTDEKGTKLVSGRELHEFLEVGRDFTTWIKGRILKYGFDENIDFTVIWNDTKTGDVVDYNGNSNSMVKLGYEKDYVITIDMAKELSMVENNDKGKQARKYFIECEKALQEVSKKALLLESIYNGGQEAIVSARQLTDLEVAEATKPLLEEIETKEEQLEEQRPFIDFVKTIETSKDSLGVGQFIKIVNDKEIDLGRNGFFCWLREKGYLNKRNEPYQRYIDQELFEVREGYYYQGKETKLSLTALITAKGQRYFVNKLREEFCKNKIND